MTPSLRVESERLTRSWERHDAVMLRDYLVADVEDPRLNVQSLLTRHFLLFSMFGDRFSGFAAEELRFATVMNWLLSLTRNSDLDASSLRHALEAGADNAEGVEIPAFVTRAFQQLPSLASAGEVPNYLASVLDRGAAAGGIAWPPPELDWFMDGWSSRLAGEPAAGRSVLEPACGSANDYRSWHQCGLARLVQYTGVDLSPKNVANAQTMFPGAQFTAGNVFELPAGEQAFEFTVVHDLFEHLSIEGLDRAVAEVSRVTRCGLCVGFFSMDEAPEHLIQPIEEYHWNRLSVDRMREAFAAHGFRGQVIHVGGFLRARVGCPTTHNPQAYTFLLGR